MLKLRLTPATYAALLAQAKATGVSLAALISNLLDTITQGEMPMHQMTEHSTHNLIQGEFNDQRSSPGPLH